MLTILFAYACAALVAPLLMFAYGAAIEGFSSAVTANETFLFTSLFASVSAVYALPVALPIIGFTEFRKRGEWKVFALAGLGLGVVMAALFTELPFSWQNLGYSIFFVPIVFACVMTYWAVAWKWLPPKAVTQLQFEMTQ
ncbi:hypothetical protein [Erythrobacter fulvus]|uniref:hypothetical protein n=1 Tax=Erythrobacter fulvus TaxID=2987523 RepID=UPI0023588C20|nr:hypothetical protein [Erythrobacter fulvus]